MKIFGPKIAIFFLCLAVTAFSLLVNHSASASDPVSLEQGVAITKNPVLKLIELSGFSIGSALSQNRVHGLLGNSDLAKLPEFAPVLASLQKEMQSFHHTHADTGVGMKFSKRLFDVGYLSNPNTRFALIGVINRMDQAFKDADTCGETRLIYRLAYRVNDKGEDVSSRLPMTINLVFGAKKKDSALDCSAVASAWKSLTDQTADPKTIADAAVAGPLANSIFSFGSLKRLEVNLQVVRWPAVVAPDFGGHAEYLMKVYQWSGTELTESSMENQIDRDRVMNDPALLKELKAWLIAPENLTAIDEGTFLIPQKFLATTAYSQAPGGIERSGNRPFFGFFSLDDLKALPYANFKTMKSPMGYLRRLNDASCVGCHQTRAIGGFHFTGEDPIGKYPGNSVFLPGSAHFFGDLNRRKAIQDQIVRGGSVDYSRGFSERPREIDALELQNTGLFNGWGAHCSFGSDPSFSRWSCAAGLKCEQLLDKSDNLGMGVCMPAGKEQIGDACESGKIITKSFNNDVYTRTKLVVQSLDPTVLCSPQSASPGQSTGGFLNGSIRKKDCNSLTAEAVCGALPAAKSGFNACLGSHNFNHCIQEFATGVGLRGCDARNPCRDDYICAQSFESTRGACVPPYFLFQFRVDGHPLSNN